MIYRETVEHSPDYPLPILRVETRPPVIHDLDERPARGLTRRIPKLRAPLMSLADIDYMPEIAACDYVVEYAYQVAERRFRTESFKLSVTRDKYIHKGYLEVWTYWIWSSDPNADKGPVPLEARRRLLEAISRQRI